MYRPDIIVQGLDRPDFRLVVEVIARRLGESELDHVRAVVSRYMDGMACPLALVVTPRTTWLLEQSDQPDSIAEVSATVSTTDLLGVAGLPEDGHALEQLVRDWLERLAPSHRAFHEPLSTVVRALQPALVDAEVALSGPR